MLYVQKQTVIPIGENMGWLEAREAVMKKGGLPSNVALDDALIYSKEWVRLRKKGYYNAWTKEVLVFPISGGAFAKGKDVFDAYKDALGRSWTFPAGCIPDAAIGKKNVGLFVDPEKVEVTSKKVTIYANWHSVLILSPFIQKLGHAGVVDRRTRVPVQASNVEGVSDDRRRWLWRREGAGVRPIARDVSYFYFARACIYSCRQHNVLGVATAKASTDNKGPR